MAFQQSQNQNKSKSQKKPFPAQNVSGQESESQDNQDGLENRNNDRSGIQNSTGIQSPSMASPMGSHEQNFNSQSRNQGTAQGQSQSRTQSAGGAATQQSSGDSSQAVYGMNTPSGTPNWSEGQATQGQIGGNRNSSDAVEQARSKQNPVGQNQTDYRANAETQPGQSTDAQFSRAQNSRDQVNRSDKLTDLEGEDDEYNSEFDLEDDSDESEMKAGAFGEDDNNIDRDETRKVDQMDRTKGANDSRGVSQSMRGSLNKSQPSMKKGTNEEAPQPGDEQSP